ncbi:metalloprotease 1 [Nannizzia gypsea CBS 118893]|uniref:Metalloprotease 1 n=1 Tax=Arthroderma gypseum (strain ATCC MYA-4604 / CBS 118893) TaxID=535722 RepID=E5QZI5_ARTGP|nr:metalloprotease 1 [Nannizzia gypsea CBS 118893]EFQ97351.1 metalloprotease 1 [Nannizzia gypsea CBS 118893]
MRFSVVLSVIAALRPVVATHGCGSSPHDSFDAEIGRLRREEGDSGHKDFHGSSTPHVTIDTYVHFVFGDGQGKLSNIYFERQIEVLNERFAPAGFSFRLLETTRTKNNEWVKQAYTDRSMVSALRQGDYATLNLFYITEYVDDIIGVCFLYPKEDPDKIDIVYDGCSIWTGTLPGTEEPELNMGMTTVHEVGHFLGLKHPFSNPEAGGCDEDADGIDDTPRQANATSGCPESKDTCPEYSGKDNIHNYMDYSDDSCMDTFTPGQIHRMHMIWQHWRRPQRMRSK